MSPSTLQRLILVVTPLSLLLAGCCDPGITIEIPGLTDGIEGSADGTDKGTPSAPTPPPDPMEGAPTPADPADPADPAAPSAPGDPTDPASPPASTPPSTPSSTPSSTPPSAPPSAPPADGASGSTDPSPADGAAGTDPATPPSSQPTEPEPADPPTSGGADESASGSGDAGAGAGASDCPGERPVADAGADQAVAPGAPVWLDGTGSHDADADPLRYFWTQRSGDPVALDEAATALPSFEAPATAGVLEFELVVSDGTWVSLSDTVRIEVRVAGAAPEPAPGAEEPVTEDWPSFERNPFRYAVDFDGERFGAWISGGMLLVADGAAGLELVDVSEPSVPRRLATVRMEGFATAVTMDGQRALVASTWLSSPDAATSLLTRLDVSAPSSPRAEASVQVPGAVHHLALTGTLLWAVGPDGATALDASTLEVLGEVSARQQAVDLAGSDAVILMVEIARGSWETTGAVRVLSVARTSAGLIAQDAAVLPRPHARCVALDGALAYVGHGLDGQGGVEVFDVSTPSSPRSLGKMGGLGEVLGVTVLDGVLFAADTNDRVTAFRLDGGGGLAMVTALHLDGHVRTADDRATVATDGRVVTVTRLGAQAGAGQLPVALIRTLAHPLLSAPAAGVGEAMGVTVSGDRAWVAARGAGLEVYEVSGPEPWPMSAGERGDLFAASIQRFGDWAYVAANSQGVHVFDVTDEERPRLVSTSDTPGIARDVKVRDGLLFVADHFHGMRVATLDDPVQPFWIDELQVPGPFDALAFSVDRAALASGTHVLVVDLSDGQERTETVALSDSGAAVASVALDAVRLVATVPGKGVGTVRLDATQASPRWWGTDADAVAVALDASRVTFAERGLDGAEVDRVGLLDLRPGGALRLRGQCDVPGSANAVEVAGARTFVAGGTTGLHILQWPAARLRDAYDVVPPGEVVGYGIDGVPGSLDIACRATSGRCKVVARDRLAGTARVEWWMGDGQGAQGIAVAIGEHRGFYVVGGDLVVVE